MKFTDPNIADAERAERQAEQDRQSRLDIASRVADMDREILLRDMFLRERGLNEAFREWKSNRQPLNHRKGLT